MADTEKLQLIEDMFNYTGDDKINFSMGNLINAPNRFIHYCIDVENDPRKSYYLLADEKSNLYDKRFISDKEEDIKQFLIDHIDIVNLNKVVLFAYYWLKNCEILPEQRNYRDECKRKLEGLIAKYDMHDVLYYLELSNMTQNGFPKIVTLDADEILGHHKNQKQKESFDFKKYNKYMKYIKYEMLLALPKVDDMYMAIVMFFDDMDTHHPELSTQERFDILMRNETFRKNIDTDNFVLAANYGIIDLLQKRSKTISIDDFESVLAEYKDLNAEANLSVFNDESFKDKFTGRNYLSEYYDICEKICEKLLLEDGSNIDRLVKTGHLNRSSFELYFEDSKDKETTLGYGLAFGLVDETRIEKICEKSKFDLQKVRNTAFSITLENSKCKEGDYLSYPVNIALFRSVIPPDELEKLITVLTKDLTKHPYSTTSSEKLSLLWKEGMINDAYIKQLYLNEKLSSEDMNTISGFIADYKIVADENSFKQNTDRLIELYKYLYAKPMLANNKEYDDIKGEFDNLPEFDEQEKELIEKNYQFQRKLFLDSKKSPATKYDELENGLGVLILYPEIAKHLYHEKLIDFQSLRELIDDTGIRPEDRETNNMVLRGEIAQEDLPFIVRGTFLEDNPLVLTQLYDAKNITYKEIINKYVDGNISYETLLRFGQGRDLSEEFDEGRYLDLFLNAIKSSRNETSKVEHFARYRRAFMLFKPQDNYENIYSNIYDRQQEILTQNFREDRIEDFYREHVIDGRNLLDLLDPNNIKFKKKEKLLESIGTLMMTQDLSVHDTEVLFRDTDGSHIKRDRLESIFKTRNIPYEVKMKILADCYKSATELDAENYSHILNTCIQSATPDEHRENGNGGQRRRKRPGGERPEQELMPYITRYSTIIAIDPETTSRILGSNIMFHFQTYGKNLFEQMYTTKDGENTQLTTHASYILSDELVEALQNQLFKLDDQGNIIGFDFGVLIDAYKHGDRTQISKTLHKSGSWARLLREKITGGNELAQQPILAQDVAEDIDLG